MNILLIGSGGREHALAWAIAKSPLLGQLYITPGNGGMADLGLLVDIDIHIHDSVIDFCREKNIELVVIGPEAPLIEGLSDDLRNAGFAVFGPSQAAAQLEGSKGFTKDICAEYNIPTADYGRFDNHLAAKHYLKEQSLPIVIKADGLAAGKGVVIAETFKEAEQAIDACFEGAFGEAGHEVVIEAFLSGEEASFFILTDGETIVPLITAQDHKRVYDGDVGPNTGGMGAYSPAPVMNEVLLAETMEKIIKPTIQAMNDKGHPYQGVLYAGLIITSKGPELIEYNARFGDPECQVLMMRLKSDLVEALLATAKGELANYHPEWHQDTALTVVMASKGYPGSYEKGSEIKDLDAASDDPNVEIFHAGTQIRDNKIIATGGRVLNVTARGKTVSEAKARAYDAIEKINWPQGFCRKDIGWRAIEREQATVKLSS